MTARSRVLGTAPLLIVSDLQRSIDFYCNKLGFVDPSVYGEPPCFAMLNRDGFDLMLSVPGNGQRARPNGPAGVWDVYMRIANVAMEAAALKAAGVALERAPEDTFYQMREMEVLDPDGYRWCFGQDISGEFLAGAEAWDAVLEAGAAKLRLVLKLAPSGWGIVGRLDSPDQNAMNLPIDVVVHEGQSLRFEMKAIDASYTGTFDGAATTLSGTWSQRGHTFPLVFHKVAG